MQVYCYLVKKILQQQQSQQQRQQQLQKITDLLFPSQEVSYE
jgi:hypothetical protein